MHDCLVSSQAMETRWTTCCSGRRRWGRVYSRRHSSCRSCGHAGTTQAEGRRDTATVARNGNSEWGFLWTGMGYFVAVGRSCGFSRWSQKGFVSGLILAMMLAVVEEVWVYWMCVVLSVVLWLGLKGWGHFSAWESGLKSYQISNLLWLTYSQELLFRHMIYTY